MKRMAPKINSETRGRVLELNQFLTSSYKISRNLSGGGIVVSASTVQRIIRDEKEKNNRKPIKKKKLKNSGSALVRKKGLVGKVARAVDNPNPPSQRQLVVKHRVSLFTIN